MPSRKIIFCIMGLIAGWLISCAYAKQELSAEEMLKRCVKEGSVALVGELVLGNEWEQVITKIATGEDEWIYVASCLSHGVYFGEDDWVYSLFWSSVTEALRKNPVVVLGLERAGVSLLNVCSLPFNEDLTVLENYMQEILPRLDELAGIGRRIKSDLAEVCAFRMRNSYEIIKARIHEEEELERRQNLRNNSNTP